MKWLRCRERGTDSWALLEGDSIAIVDGSPFGHHTDTGRRLPLAQVDWLTPCQPTKMLALWNNFGAAAAKNGWTRPAEPLWFLKSPNSFAAHGQAIPLPRGYDGRVAYEGELAIVIGRRARAVPVADAAAHILGYTCANDVTALELLQRDPSFPQWARAKGFAGEAAVDQPAHARLRAVGAQSQRGGLGAAGGTGQARSVAGAFDAQCFHGFECIGGAIGRQRRDRAGAPERRR